MMQQGIWGDMMKQVVQDEIPADADTIVTDAPIVDTPAQWSDDASAEPATNLDDISFGIKACDDYVALLKCVIQKAPDWLKSTYEQGFVQVIQIIKSSQGSYLEQVCQGIMDDVQSQKADFAQYGCTIE